MLKSVKVFIIDMVPEIAICQLPSMLIDINHFSEHISRNGYKLCFVGLPTKQIIEDAFMRHGYNNLIILKMTDYPSVVDGTLYTEYCLVDMTMIDLLEMANQSRKFQELKTFW